MNKLLNHAAKHRRGYVVVLFGFMIPVFVGFAALCVDTAVLAVARGQLSTAADAASLAGAQQLADDYRLQGITDLTFEIGNANTQAQSFGQANKVLAQAPIVNADPENDGTGDILIGYLDPTNPQSTLDSSPGASGKYNSVQVKLKRSQDHVAPVPTFYGLLMGFKGTDVTIQSTSTAWPYSIKGYQSNGVNNLNLLPIVLDVNTYNAMIAGQTQDNYTWNPSTGTVTPGPDGVTESVLYPVGSGSPGNWGTIRVGVATNGTSLIGSQIMYGITPAQLATYPNSTIQLDPTLSPPSITFQGNPGISAGLKPAIDAIIGKPVVIPIYDILGMEGTNCWFRVIEFAPVRILSDNFQANPKYVIIQPAYVRDSTAIPGSPEPGWTQGGLIRLHLSR
jgi:Flp pilus assembly protein TadG